MTRGGWPPPAQDTLPTEIQPLQAGRFRTPCVTQKGRILNHAHFHYYGSYIDDLKRGDTVVVADAEADPRTAPTADALKAISAQSFINMPLTEQEGLVALLYLNHASARLWPQEELAFVREVASRTRMAVERRRAERDLQALANQRGRGLQDNCSFQHFVALTSSETYR